MKRTDQQKKIVTMKALSRIAGMIQRIVKTMIPYKNSQQGNQK